MENDLISEAKVWTKTLYNTLLSLPFYFTYHNFKQRWLINYLFEIWFLYDTIFRQNSAAKYEILNLCCNSKVKHLKNIPKKKKQNKNLKNVLNN